MIPSRLYLSDAQGQPKPLRVDFAPGDEFYRSYDIQLSMGKRASQNFPGATLKLPEASCDWSRIALLHDRWRYKPKQGIVRIVWGALSQHPVEFNSAPFQFECRHDPEIDPPNYAHCLIDARDVQGRVLGKDVEVDEVENRRVRQEWARWIFPVEKQVMPPGFAFSSD